MLDVLKSNKAENDFVFDWNNIKTFAPDKLGKQRQISPSKLQI